jgi:hypothetical protein
LQRQATVGSVIPLPLRVRPAVLLLHSCIRSAIRGDGAQQDRAIERDQRVRTPGLAGESGEAIMVDDTSCHHRRGALTNCVSVSSSDGCDQDAFRDGTVLHCKWRGTKALEARYGSSPRPREKPPEDVHVWTLQPWHIRMRDGRPFAFAIRGDERADGHEIMHFVINQQRGTGRAYREIAMAMASSRSVFCSERGRRPGHRRNGAATFYTRLRSFR